MAIRLCIIGEQTGTHVAGSIAIAARQMGCEVTALSPLDAWPGPAILRSVSWRLMDRRPVRLRGFSQRVVRVCEDWKPDVLLTTGFAPVDLRGLASIGALGVARINYLTDDPWNASSGSRWFRRTLPGYDVVCSPRLSNLEDLTKLGCPNVQYVRFGYGPELHFPVTLTSEEADRLACDVLFVGGADPDRVPWIRELIDAGLSVGLYGNYWERYPETRDCARGSADPSLLGKATLAASIALCLVRKANRDGHVMRTFEIPAVGACMLIEGTEEHRSIFGAEGQAAMYFKTPPEMVAKAKELLANDSERRRLTVAAHRLIVEGANTYGDRLRQMLGFIPRLSHRVPAADNMAESR